MSLKISTLSVMVGTPACNLICPFCISKQTYRTKPLHKNSISLENIEFLAKIFLGAKDGIPYGIVTGKGEPTLVPKETLGEVFYSLYKTGIAPELQTNGILLSAKNMEYWYKKGLKTVAISCVSHLDKINSQILSSGKINWNLGKIAGKAKNIGLLVRLTATMTRGGIDSADSVLAFLKWAKEAGAHQVTFRKMGKPRDLALPGSQAVADWIDKNYVDPNIALNFLIENKARESDPLPWARKFSYNGLSVVVTEHMTPPKDGLVRSAVIQPDGHLYGSWDDPADILV